MARKACLAYPPPDLKVYSPTFRRTLNPHVCDFEEGHSGPHGCKLCEVYWDNESSKMALLEVVIEENING